MIGPLHQLPALASGTMPLTSEEIQNCLLMDHVPAELLCPISLQLITKPMFIPNDGTKWHFERDCLENWWRTEIDKGKICSHPMTRNPLVAGPAAGEQQAPAGGATGGEPPVGSRSSTSSSRPDDQYNSDEDHAEGADVLALRSELGWSDGSSSGRDINTAGSPSARRVLSSRGGRSRRRREGSSTSEVATSPVLSASSPSAPVVLNENVTKRNVLNTLARPGGEDIKRKLENFQKLVKRVSEEQAFATGKTEPGVPRAVRGAARRTSSASSKAAPSALASSGGGAGGTIDVPRQFSDGVRGNRWNRHRQDANASEQESGNNGSSPRPRRTRAGGHFGGTLALVRGKSVSAGGVDGRIAQDFARENVASSLASAPLAARDTTRVPIMPGSTFSLEQDEDQDHEVLVEHKRLRTKQSDSTISTAASLGDTPTHRFGFVSEGGT